jgi:hypothetical protein
MLGVVQLGAGKPAAARQRSILKNCLVGFRRFHFTEVPDRGPEAIKVGHRPFPQLLIGGEIEAARFPSEVMEKRSLQKVESLQKKQRLWQRITRITQISNKSV